MDKNKNTQVKTVILSDDPRFIEHVKKEVERIKERRLDARKSLALKDPTLRLCRTAFDRLQEAGLTDPKKLAEEYGLCLRRMSVQPAAVRSAVMEICGVALHKHAVELAKETDDEAC